MCSFFSLIYAYETWIKCIFGYRVLDTAAADLAANTHISDCARTYPFHTLSPRHTESCLLHTLVVSTSSAGGRRRVAEILEASIRRGTLFQYCRSHPHVVYSIRPEGALQPRLLPSWWVRWRDDGATDDICWKEHCGIFYGSYGIHSYAYRERRIERLYVFHESMKASLGPKKYQGLIFPPTNENDETNSEVMSETSVSTESPDTVQSAGKTNFFKERPKYDYRYGKKRLSPGFKKYCLSENTDLFRVTFKCGLDRHGSPCEHRIGIFHTLRDDVQELGDGEYLYNGRKLGWGNVVPAIDKRTQGKLAQTWQAHFAIKHGWDKTSDSLPIECRLKSKHWSPVAELWIHTQSKAIMLHHDIQLL